MPKGGNIGSALTGAGNVASAAGNAMGAGRAQQAPQSQNQQFKWGMLQPSQQVQYRPNRPQLQMPQQQQQMMQQPQMNMGFNPMFMQMLYSMQQQPQQQYNTYGNIPSTQMPPEMQQQMQDPNRWRSPMQGGGNLPPGVQTLGGGWDNMISGNPSFQLRLPGPYDAGYNI